MNTTRELQTAQATTHLGANRAHPRERTGVRFVLTNTTDPGRADDYSAWYDDYEHAIIRPGLLANAFRFENPTADGTPTDPRYAAIYDIVTPDPHRPGQRPRTHPAIRHIYSTIREAASSRQRSAPPTR